MDWLFSLLFSNQYVLFLLGAIAVLLLYRWVAPMIRLRSPVADISAGSLMTKLLGRRFEEGKQMREVARYKKEGNFLAAGKLLEDNLRLPEAAEAYLDGNEYWAAASMFEKMNKVDRAAELYLQGGDHKKAAQILADAGKPGRAAALFLEKGNVLEAARLFGLASEWGRAADLYARAGYPLRAAEAYEKKNDFIKAAECYEKHFMENVSYSTTYSATAVPTADQKSAFHAGRLYEKSGELQRAFHAYSRGGYFKEAAGVSMNLGQYSKAAELYLRGEQSESAALAYEKAGDTVAAANLRGEIALRQERIPEAAACFQKGQDYLRAAELFEQVDMLAEAAGAYEAGESWAAAGSVYIRAGLKEKAARSYERAGDLETAARLYEEAGFGQQAIDLYEKAGFTFSSGEAAARAGDRDKAIALLQQVSASDENYGAATEILARLFIEGGMTGLAVERIQKTLAGAPVSKETLDLYYWLGVAHEATGRRDEALDVFRKIQAEDLQFRDVEKRVARLESPSRPSPTPVPGPAGPPEDRRQLAIRRLQDRGIATLKVCSQCGRCYDHRSERCSEDRSLLVAPRVVPFVLLDRYRLVRVLGEGGMGMVFKAHDQRLDRTVAIKIVAAEEINDPLTRNRLEREARVVARIKHPGVIAIYDSGELEDGSAFLVMELLEGADLGSILKTYGRGKPAQVASLLRQTGAAVGAAHRMGVIHRDLKPQNLFFVNGKDGFQVKVLDFGIAKARTIEASVTQSGMIMGTPAYISPEQIHDPNVDARSDLYSIAVVGFEALTGVRLIAEAEILKMLFAVMNDPAPLPSSRLPGIPAEIDRAFADALAKDPKDRPGDLDQWVGSVAEMLERLKPDTQGWPEKIPLIGARGAPPAALDEGPTAEMAAPPPRPSATPAPSSPAASPSTSVHAAAAPRAEAATAQEAAKPARFTIKEILGEGSLGSVNRAEDRVDGRSVALRRLPKALLTGQGVLAALTADLKAAAQVSHPNLVKVLGLVNVEGHPSVISEYVQGKNFAEALKAGHKMAMKQAHSLARVLAQVLSLLHSKGLVHGSIQPSNIMVASGVVKVADLGLGRLAFTVTPALNYRAPENQLDVAGDLYGLAACVYHLLTGTHPKSQSQGVALPLPSTLAVGVPEAFDKLLLRCLHPRQALRFSTADAILDELAEMVRFA
jgi:serine/threonine protein kinase/tetratricopeptide (TPR) repeat protein